MALFLWGGKLLTLTLLRSVSVNLAELRRAPEAGGGDVEMFESANVRMLLEAGCLGRAASPRPPRWVNNVGG